MRRREKTEKFPLSVQLGILLFLVGVIGFLYWYSQSRIFSLDAFLTDQVETYLEVRNVHEIKESDYPGVRAFLQDQLQSDFHFGGEMGLEGWIGDKVAVADFGEEARIWAFANIDEAKVKDLLHSLLIEDERFMVVDYRQGEVWTPAFSSELGFGFSGSWFFMATDESLLKQQFRSKDKLKKSEAYQKLFKDLPGKGMVRGFFNLKAHIRRLAQDPQYLSRQPVLQALSESVDYAGLVGRLKDGHLTFYTKTLVHEEIFHQDYLTKKSGTIVPELAGFVPGDGLYFMTGYDLFGKYQHTRHFLSTLNPQFGVIFEGILRAKSQDLFGDTFDLEKDFLSQMNGQYAIWMNQSDKLTDGLQYVFITGFGGADKERSLSQLLEAIQYAQSRFMSEVQVVELPDGTVREELVSVRPSDIPIRKVETDFGAYYTFEQGGMGKSFSFGFLNGYLVFSTARDAMEKVISSLDGSLSSLSVNDDFRESVLFRYAPSESYGFMSTSQIDRLAALLFEEEKAPALWKAFTLFSQDIRNISFARRVYPSEIFITFTFFGR